MFQWYTAAECDSIPEVVYVFQVSDPKKTNQAANETWPPFYPLWAPFHPARDCGNSKVPIPGYCCTAIEDPQDAFGIHSVTTQELETLPADQSRFPIVMNGHNFCVVDKILDYTELYIGPTGFCVEDVISCDLDGTLRLYSDQNCSGTVETFSLNADTSRFTSLSLGSFTASLRTVSTGTGKVGWTEFASSRTKVIVNFLPSEIVATLLYVIILIMETLLIVYFAYRYYITRLNSVLFHLICHCAWIIYVCLSINYVYHRWGEYLPYRNSLVSRSFFFGLANLFTAISTTNFLFVFWRLNTKSSVALYAVILLIHFGLLGGRYLYAAGFPVDDFSDLRFQDFLVYWTNKISYLWIIFLFAYDLLPIIYLVARIPTSAWTEKKVSSLRNAIEFFRIDKISAISFLLQVIILIGYFINEHIRSYTALLGNDRNHQATASYTIFLIVLHSALNTIVVYRIAGQVKSGVFLSQDTFRT